MSPSFRRSHTAGEYVRGRQPRRAIARGGLAILGALLLIGLVVLSQLGENGFMSWRRLQQRQRQIAAEVSGLEATNAALQQKIDALAEDPFTLEKIAREEHNMRRPDEEVLQVLPPASGPGTAGDPQDPRDSQDPKDQEGPEGQEGQDSPEGRRP